MNPIIHAVMTEVIIFPHKFEWIETSRNLNNENVKTNVSF